MDDFSEMPMIEKIAAFMKEKRISSGSTCTGLAIRKLNTLS